MLKNKKITYLTVKWGRNDENRYDRDMQSLYPNKFLY